EGEPRPPHWPDAAPSEHPQAAEAKEEAHSAATPAQRQGQGAERRERRAGQRPRQDSLRRSLATPTKRPYGLRPCGRIAHLLEHRAWASSTAATPSSAGASGRSASAS